MLSLGRACLLAVCCFAVAGCVGPLEERSWVEARTPNVVIWSALSERSAVRLAIELEEFRYAVAIVTSVGHIEERIPTQIYLLPGAAPELGFPEKFAGLFRQGLRANVALVRPVPRVKTGEVLYHEFTHFLLNNHNAQNYPAWFHEGFAELLATLRVEGDAIEFGRPNRGRMATLVHYRWRPFKWILNARDPRLMGKEESALFYAQSWALVHYLHFGRDVESFGADNGRFLYEIERGVPTEEAFETAFGIAVKDLAQKITRYVGADLRFLRFTMPEGFLRPEVQVRSMAQTEVLTLLGSLSLAHDAGTARDYFQKALLENPADARAIAGLADSYKIEGRYAEAEPLFERAAVLDPNDPLNRLDLAAHLIERSVHSEDPDEQIGLARRALAESEAADALRPGQAETLAMVGQAELLLGDSPEAGVAALEAAHARLPSFPPLKLWLAQAYLQAGRPAQATPLLRAVLAWSHGGHEAAESLLAALAGRVDEGVDEPEQPRRVAPQ